MAQSDPSFEQTLAAIDGVEGWLSVDQARRLWDAASALGERAHLVEIGSFRGRSAIVLATAAGEGCEVVAIDPHAGNDRGPQQVEGISAVEEAELDHKAFNENLAGAGVADRVRHVRKFSYDAVADTPDVIDLLYVDGAHQYRPAASDIRSFGAKVRPGGTMLVHDSFSSLGVTLAILTELLASREWRYVGRSRSLAEYRKDAPRGLGRVSNAARQLAQLPWFVRNLAVKVLLVLKLRGVASAVFRHHEASQPY